MSNCNRYCNCEIKLRNLIAKHANFEWIFICLKKKTLHCPIMWLDKLIKCKIYWLDIIRFDSILFDLLFLILFLSLAFCLSCCSVYLSRCILQCSVFMVNEVALCSYWSVLLGLLRCLLTWVLGIRYLVPQLCFVESMVICLIGYCFFQLNGLNTKHRIILRIIICLIVFISRLSVLNR